MNADQQALDWLEEYRSPTASAADLLCDRHDPEAVAFTLVEPDMTSESMTWGQLADESRRMATVLAAKGIQRGECVPVLLGKRRALVVTLLGLWRLGAVHVPLFTAFATGAIELRTESSGARFVVTDASQREKVDPLAVTVLDVDDVPKNENTVSLAMKELILSDQVRWSDDDSLPSLDEVRRTVEPVRVEAPQTFSSPFDDDDDRPPDVAAA